MLNTAITHEPTPPSSPSSRRILLPLSSKSFFALACNSLLSLRSLILTVTGFISFAFCAQDLIAFRLCSSTATSWRNDLFGSTASGGF
jgi:hypothetical protein